MSAILVYVIWIFFADDNVHLCWQNFVNVKKLQYIECSWYYDIHFCLLNRSVEFFCCEKFPQNIAEIERRWKHKVVQ